MVDGYNNGPLSTGAYLFMLWFRLVWFGVCFFFLVQSKNRCITVYFKPVEQKNVAEKSSPVFFFNRKIPQEIELNWYHTVFGRTVIV